MNERPFVLNNRFLINPSIGSVNDQQTKSETRIEPRLMNLLCLLVSHKDKLVARAFITKEIWDDYGNADEGLTQGISYLRKVLADDDKSLIETVPKKGYILHASVSEAAARREILPAATSSRQRYILIVGLLFVLMVAAFFIVRSLQDTKQRNLDTLRPGQKVNNADKINKASGPDVVPDTTKDKSSNADKVK